MNRLRKNGPTLQLLQNAFTPSRKRILDKDHQSLYAVFATALITFFRKRYFIAALQTKAATAQDQTKKVG